MAKDYRYVNGAALSYSPRDTDLTFCHDVPKTVPACLSAAVVHARENTQKHETGEAKWISRPLKDSYITYHNMMIYDILIIYYVIHVI